MCHLPGDGAHNLYADEEQAVVRVRLTDELHRLQEAVGDERYALDV